MFTVGKFKKLISKANFIYQTRIFFLMTQQTIPYKTPIAKISSLDCR